MAERTVFSRGYLVYAGAVMFFANFLNYMDRQVVSALEDEITTGLAVGPARFGFLWTAFTLGYMFVSPFIGYFADRVHRGRLFAVCILVWSMATIGSGLAGTYAILFVMRILIGIGEAGCLIIGPTLIVDYFPSRMRGRAMSLFFLGMPLGGAAGFVAAGTIADATGLFGAEAWRWAFYLAGLPGIVLAMLILTLHQPQRGASDREPTGLEFEPAPLASASLRSYIALLKVPTLFLLILAQAFASFTLVPLVHFGVNFFEVHAELSKKGATLTLGIMALVAGLLGNTLGGWLGDMGRKRHAGAYALLTAVGFGIGCPATILGLRLVRIPGFAEFAGYACIFVSLTMFFMCMPLLNTQMANVVRPQQRAVAFAAAIFVLHLLGDTISPPLFGVIKGSYGDLFAFTVFPLSLILASLLSFAAYRTAARDVAAVSAHVEESSAQ